MNHPEGRASAKRIFTPHKDKPPPSSDKLSPTSTIIKYTLVLAKVPARQARWEPFRQRLNNLPKDTRHHGSIDNRFRPVV